MAKYRLGDICEIVSGSTPKSGVAEYWDGDIKWITPAELNDDSYIVNDTIRKITSLGVQKSGMTPFPAGTVILSSRAPIGKVAIAGCEMYCNQGFKNLICSDVINNRFLYWFLKGKTAYLNSLGRGATFKEISKQIVASIEIKVPPLEQQIAIVELLEKTNEIIKLRGQELCDFDTLIKARFVEMFDADAPIVKLGSICKMINGDRGKNYPSGNDFVSEGIPFVNAGHLQNRIVDFAGMNYITEAKYNLLSQGKIQTGDILYCLRGSLGKHALVTFDQGAIASSLVILRCDTKRVLPRFLLYAIETPEIEKQLKAANNGSSQPNLSAASVKAYEIKLPPIVDQQAFVNFVSQVDKSKAVVQAALDKAQLLFDSLMQQYFG